MRYVDMSAGLMWGKTPSLWASATAPFEEGTVPALMALLRGLHLLRHVKCSVLLAVKMAALNAAF